MSVYRQLCVVAVSIALTSFAYAVDKGAICPPKPIGSIVDTTPRVNMANSGVTKVDINHADAQELMKVKGMSASKAKAIVSYRKKHGEFKSMDELKTVKGFKRVDETKMKDLVEQLTIN